MKMTSVGLKVVFTMEQKELLINAVFTYPCLWDICDNNYHNKYKKESAWNRVSEKCGGGFIDGKFICNLF